MERTEWLRRYRERLSDRMSPEDLEEVARIYAQECLSEEFPDPIAAADATD